MPSRSRKPRVSDCTTRCRRQASALLAANALGLAAAFEDAHSEMCGTEAAFRVMGRFPAPVRVGLCRTGGPWLERLFNSTTFMQNADPFVYVNAGANKGYNIAQVLQTLGGASFSNDDWMQQMIRHMKAGSTKSGKTTRYLCGVCRLCLLKRNDIQTLASLNVSVHAFEALPELHAWLKSAFAHFAVQGAVVHAAVGNESGTTHTLITPAAHADNFGWESSVIQEPRPGESRDPKGRPLTQITLKGLALDDYFRKYGLERVHYLSADVERQEGNLLAGMRHALSRRAIDVLELELGSAGWVGTTVKATLAWLNSLGYDCYWQAVSCLVPISGRCYNERYVDALLRMGGSNLVCAHGEARRGLRSQVAHCHT